MTQVSSGNYVIRLSCRHMNMSLTVSVHAATYLLRVSENSTIEVDSLLLNAPNTIVLVIKLLTHRCSQCLEPFCHVRDFLKIVVEYIFQFVVRCSGLELLTFPLFLLKCLLSSGPGTPPIWPRPDVLLPGAIGRRLTQAILGPAYVHHGLLMFIAFFLVTL